MENNQSETAPQKHSRKRLQTFRFAEASPLTEEQMPMEGIDDSVLAGFNRLVEAGGSENHGEKLLCLFREPHDDGLSLCYAWFKSGFVLPRHSHDADCLYYVISGEVHLGKQVLRKGDGFFVPADSPYSYETGPEGAEVLEFRNAVRFNLLFRNNDEAHWKKMARAIQENSEKWRSELVPPSERRSWED